MDFSSHSDWKCHTIQSDLTIRLSFFTGDLSLKSQRLARINFNLKFTDLLSIFDDIFRLLNESLIFPLQERLDDWKKSVVQTDKDHAKGSFFPKTLQNNCLIFNAPSLLKRYITLLSITCWNDLPSRHPTTTKTSLSC